MLKISYFTIIYIIEKKYNVGRMKTKAYSQGDIHGLALRTTSVECPIIS